mgnify:CR=1 FL=1
MLRRGRSVVVVFVPLSSVDEQADEQQAQRSGDDENADEDADYRGAALLFLRQRRSNRLLGGQGLRCLSYLRCFGNRGGLGGGDGGRLGRRLGSGRRRRLRRPGGYLDLALKMIKDRKSTRLNSSH